LLKNPILKFHKMCWRDLDFLSVIAHLCNTIDCSQSFGIRCGVPQGSILRLAYCLLWD